VEQVRALVRESTSDDNMAALVVAAASERAQSIWLQWLGWARCV
jgi:hypothetical protein